MKRVLNVGGNSKETPIPQHYAGFEHVLLDIAQRGSTDIVCDARKLASLEASQFDAVYCSHNLEHYYRHDVPKVLSGIFHILKFGGFAQIKVPDIAEVMRVTMQRNLDIDDVLYQSPAGPIMVIDVLYGYSVEIERSEQDFYAHKTGFTQKSLLDALTRSGFKELYSKAGNLEVDVLAFKGSPDKNTLLLLNLPGKQSSK